MRLRILTCLGVLFASAAAWAGDAPKTAQTRPATRPTLHEYELDKLVAYSLSDGVLRARICAPAELRGRLATRFLVAGSSARWSMRTSDRTPDGAVDGEVYELAYEDLGAERAEGHAKATLYVNGDDYICISGSLRRSDRSITIVYHGHPETHSMQLEVYSQEHGEMIEPLINAQAESLQQLSDEHSEEFDLYVAPVLKKLTQRNLFGPGAADVYGAFASIEPDSPTVRTFQNILPRLESIDPAERELASKQVAAMGSAGVLAAMRHDPNELGPEQNARLATVVESQRRQRIVTVQEARKSVLFLLEAMEYDDPAVRAAAKHELEKLAHRKLDFDPRGGWELRCRQVEMIRDELREPPVLVP